MDLSLGYNGWLLVSAGIYITISKNLLMMSWTDIYQIFPNSSKFLLDPENEINLIFGKFLGACFEVELEELLPFVQYVAQFCEMTFSYEIPESFKAKDLTGVFFCL